MTLNPLFWELSRRSYLFSFWFGEGLFSVLISSAAFQRSWQLATAGWFPGMHSGWVVSGEEDGAGRGRWRGQGNAGPWRLLSTPCSQGCLLCGPQAWGLWRVEYHLLIYHGWWWEGLETQEHSQRSSKREKNKTQNNQTHTYTKEKPGDTLTTEIKCGWKRKRA